MTNCSAMTHNLFSFTHFRENASASPLESHSFKTKDLKPFRFTHLQKKGGGRVPLSNIQPHPFNLRSSLSPLDSALTSKRASKSFTSNTYEKHTQGEGGLQNTNHQSRVTSHESPAAVNCQPRTGSGVLCLINLLCLLCLLCHTISPTLPAQRRTTDDLFNAQDRLADASIGCASRSAVLLRCRSGRAGKGQSSEEARIEGGHG